MNISFKFADKSRLKVILSDCFKILRSNMEMITPDGKTYEEAFSEWDSAVSPAMSKDARQMILIFDEDDLIGFFMYYVSSETFMMEEIQIDNKHQRSGVFALLYKWLLPKLPEYLKTTEAFAHKSNMRSQKILEHLGLTCLNQDGEYLCYKGSFKTLLEWCKHTPSD